MWAAAGAAGLGAASYAATGFLMRVAMDRELPRLPNLSRARVRLCGITDAETFFRRLEQIGERLKRAPCRTVEITAPDGAVLVGHWFPCKDARRVIVAMHGWRSCWWRDFGMVAEFWRENGCSVLYAEQRGQNGSGGDYIGFGLTERFDCPLWAKWAEEQTEGRLPIYLAGVSMGATTVLMAAGLELPAGVRGIIADCGFTSPCEIWKHVARHNLHLPFGMYSMAADGICRRKIRMGCAAYSTVQAMAQNRLPVLFIHGADDHFVPVEMTYENYKACAAPKQLFVVPGADHGMSYLLEPAGYQAAMRRFWETCGG